MDIETLLTQADQLDAKAMANDDGYESQVRIGLLIAAQELRQRVFRARCSVINGGPAT